MKPLPARPWLLALLTLGVALVPVWFALRNYREESRLKDAQLFEATSDLVAERLQLITVRHLNFLNIMRNLLRGAPGRDPARDAVPPPGNWRASQPHLIAYAYAANENDHAIIRWTNDDASAPVKPGDDLTTDPRIAGALQRAQQNPLPLVVGTPLDQDRLFIVDTLPDRNRTDRTRGFLVGWFDLASLCQDTTVPLLKNQVLIAKPLTDKDPAPAGARTYPIKEGDATWRLAILRGPQFQPKYGQVPPTLVFLSCALSAVLLALMVMQATRAARLRTALATERELGRVRSHFIHSVSHEFRTPLSVILSGADLLEAHAAQLTPQRRSEVFAQIKDSTQRMNEMVEQVLLLGRIESGTLKSNPKPVDATALCQEIADEVSTATHERCPIVVHGIAGQYAVDASLLRSILGNLLSNAVKYSDAGKTVKLEITSTDGTLRFFVRDEGVGIPADELSKVREAFQRGGNIGEVAGTGLGLAIVERCVRLHGGTLTIESQERVGTSATVTIPRA